MKTIAITLNEDQLARFQKPAELLGVPPEVLAQASFERFLSQTDDEIDAIILEVIRERGEVLRRLAR